MKNKLKSVAAFIFQNWPTKVLSLVLALVAWIFIVQYNPEDTRKISNVKIQVNTTDSVPAGEGLVLVTDYDKTLDITYKATRDVISMLNTDKITAYVDLSSATKSGEYKFPVKIDTGGQNIEVIDQSVKDATLKFEKSATAQVQINVTVEGAVAEGYVKNDPVCVPNVISIEGPESKIKQISSAEIKISEKEFTQTKSYQCEYNFIDAEGKVVTKDYIIADVDKVDVTVTVQKIKTIPINATLVNSSGGYEGNFANISITPATITIAGGEDTVETLNSYDLGTIDISEKKEDFEQEYVVTLQNGIKNVDNVSSVIVKVDFGDVRTKKIRFTDFSIENLPSNQKASVINKSLEVTFRGIASDIEKINSSNVKLIVDFQNKEQTNGRNNVSVYAVIPESYKVGVLGKYQISVNISK